MSIVTQIRLILNDTGTFWPDPVVYDAVNEAQWQVWAETRWSLTTATMTTSAGADIVSIPSTILIPRWIEGTNTNYNPPVVKRIFPSTHRNLESFLRTWRSQEPGQPEFMVLWDATHLRLFPRPSDTRTWTIFGVGYPVEVTTVLQDLVGPNSYQDGILYLAASILFEPTRPDLADMYYKEAVSHILSFKKLIRNNQSHNIRTLRPATQRLEIEQSGQIGTTPSYYVLEG